MRGIVVSYQKIISLVDQIAGRFRPKRIILFGSYAYGTPTEDSDVDLMVVTRFRGESWRTATAIRKIIDIDFPLDIIVRSPAEIDRRLVRNDFFLMDVVENGIVLYESLDRAVDRKSRRRLRNRLSPVAVAQAQPL